MKNGSSKIELPDDKYPGYGHRHIQSIFLFFCLMVAYGMRVTMSVAIVAMTDKDSTLENVTTFRWNKQIQDLILSSFFWGYAFMQIPGGQLAHRYGAKYLLVCALGVNGFVALLIPSAAKMAGWKAVCACRILQGLAQGSFLPSLHTLQGKWIPISERGRLSTFVYGGAQLGTVIVMPLSGLLAASSYGWPLIFYIVGSANLITGITWWRYGAETPAVHETISKDERDYIQESLGQTKPKTVYKVPWRSILTSVPVWAMTVGHMGSSWIHVTLFTETPSYLNKIMGINIKSNGFLSALPFLGNWIFCFIFSFISDYLINRKVFSVSRARKIANTTSHFGAAFGLIILTLVPPSQVTLGVITLVTLVSLKAAMYVGFHVNHIDLAPNFAGTLMSISNTAGNLGSMCAPLLVGYILQDEYNHNQWKIVFYISAAMGFVSNLVYITFGSADLASWNEPENHEKSAEMEVLKKNEK